MSALTDLIAALESEGFELEDTGGNCKAFVRREARRPAEHNSAIYLTSAASPDGGRAPEELDEACFVTIENAHGETLLEMKFPSVAAFLACVESFE